MPLFCTVLYVLYSTDRSAGEGGGGAAAGASPTERRAFYGLVAAAAVAATAARTLPGRGEGFRPRRGSRRGGGVARYKRAGRGGEEHVGGKKSEPSTPVPLSRRIEGGVRPPAVTSHPHTPPSPAAPPPPHVYSVPVSSPKSRSTIISLSNRSSVTSSASMRRWRASTSADAALSSSCTSRRTRSRHRSSTSTLSR